ncbi:MAG: DMT family transporter [Flavobacteriales bacterium]|nr:DMT family transporter [Flavobacteriales bacterium]
MGTKQSNLILLHVTVLIFGFTAILGKLIETPSDKLVFWRMAIAALSIGIFAYAAGEIKKSLRTNAFKYGLIGLIIAAHWITFFEAVKVSNVSVTLACMSASTLFTSVIEPIAFRRRIHPGEVALGITVIGGLVLIFSFETEYALGITYALISALLASVFNVVNGTFIRNDNPIRISLVEMMAGTVGIGVWLLLSGKMDAEIFIMPPMDWFWIGVLGTVCTAFAFVASVKVMEVLTPFTVSLTINLEPVYGIILAFFIFGESERMTGGFYAGTAILILALFANAAMKSYAMRKAKSGSV